MDNQLFRKKSLDKVSSPEQLNDYIRVSNPGVWIALSAVIVLLFGVCIWGIFGRLENEIRPLLDGVTVLIWDLAELEYMSAAGLRLLRAAQKVMDTQGKMLVTNANEAVLELFEITGFTSILTLE